MMGFVSDDQIRRCANENEHFMGLWFGEKLWIGRDKGKDVRYFRMENGARFVPETEAHRLSRLGREVLAQRNAYRLRVLELQLEVAQHRAMKQIRREYPELVPLLDALDKMMEFD